VRAVDLDERRLGGRISGVLWTVGGLSLLVYPWLPGVTRNHVGWVTMLAVAAMLWGVSALSLIDWEQTGPWLIHASTLASLGAIGAAVASTGGSVSSAWVYFLWIGLYAAYFFERKLAIAYMVACLAGQALPLLYDPRGLHNGFLAELLTAAAGFATVGGAMMAAQVLMTRGRDRTELLAAEQAALQRVARAVIGGQSADIVYDLAAVEAARVLGAEVTSIFQITSDGARVLGSGGLSGSSPLRRGSFIPIAPDEEIERALLSSAPVRADGRSVTVLGDCLKCTATVVAPVRVRGQLWGVIAAGSVEPGRFRRSTEHGLMGFVGLLGVVIENLEDRARLAAQALTDPLTGLANQRALRQRLAADLGSAHRHGRTLAVAMLDLDNFKQINDVGGHDAGDLALKVVADSLRSLARRQDTVGRLGGDEFMWILPDTDHEQARRAVERARAKIANSVKRPVPTTASAGVCDSETGAVPAEIVRMADVALYASKAHGRNRTTVYEPSLMSSADE